MGASRLACSQKVRCWSRRGNNVSLALPVWPQLASARKFRCRLRRGSVVFWRFLVWPFLRYFDVQGRKDERKTERTKQKKTINRHDKINTVTQTQTPEMLRIKFMTQERSRDDIGSLQNLNTTTLPAWERRNGPNSDF